MRTIRASLALAALLVGATTYADTPPPAPSAPSTTADATLAPIAGDWMQSFGELGWIAAPVGATDARPIVVAVHGMGDRPEWECSAWRAVFGPRPFIVCPQGKAWQVNFAWSSPRQIRGAIDALLEAARTRYGAHLDDAHRVYVGFSQGAIMGARVVRDDPGTYSHVLFQEGFDDLLITSTLDGSLKKSGVARVLLGCSQGGCASRRTPIRSALQRAGIEARVNDAGPRGHTIDETVIRSVRRDVPWLLEGDDAWRDVALDVAGGS